MSQGRVDARRRELGYDRHREPAYEGRRESAYERRLEVADERDRHAPYEPPAAGGETPTRRTIVIRGQVADRAYPARRPSRTVQERAIARPDRVAMWAVMLGLLLVIVAATSGHS